MSICTRMDLPRGTKHPAIIWPAPGFPALLEPQDRHLDLIVASRSLRTDEVRGWIQQIALSDPTGRTIVPLTLEELAPAESGEIAELAGQFAALPNAKGLCFVRARLRAPRSLPVERPRAVQLFDVRVNGVVERAHSVAAFRQRGTTLNLAFASDLHVAMLWEEIAAAVDRYAPELAGVLVHPHRLLERFIDEANSLAARGDLDLVVLGGDLVDHVQPQPRAKRGDSDAATNVGRLLAMLARLEVPTLVIPGNHDYRAFPWRPRLYGLGVVGIPWEQSKSLLRKAGLWDYWPLCRREVDALCTTDAAGMPALSDYLTQLAPATDYSCSVRGLRLLFSSTGCDILARWQELEPARWGLLLRGLRRAWYNPDSEGFSEAQLTRIRGWLRESRGAALFFHAPLLAAGAGVRIEQRLARLDPGPQESLAARVRFERRIQQAGLRCGVSFRNPGVLIRELAAAAGPVATFSGHLHWASAMEMDRRTMQVRSVEPSQAAARPNTITLLTAPALGQVKPGVMQRPGYLLARFVDGALVWLEPRTLDPGR